MLLCIGILWSHTLQVELCHCSYAHSCCQVCVKPSHWSPRSTEENSQCLPVPALLYSDVQRSQNPLWNEAWECELITVLHMQSTLIVSHQCPQPTCLKPSCVIYPCAGFALLSIEGSSFSGAGHLCPPLFLIDELQVGSWKLEFNNLLKINTVNATCGITHPLVNCACCTVPHLLHPHVNCKSGAAVKLWM